MKRFFGLAPVLVLLFLSPKVAGVLGPILMLAGLVFIHELGHFLAAKHMGMPVEVFSLGFGPRLLGFQWKETDVRLCLLPLGGYVKLSGYNPEDPDAEDPHGFLKQPYGKRMLFYSGGVLANVATGFVLLTVLGTNHARITQIRYTGPLSVMQVVKDGAADQGGLKEGDQILALGELTFPGKNRDDATRFIQKSAGQPIPIAVQRNGEALRLTLTPKDEGGLGRIGVLFGGTAYEVEKRAFAFKDLGTGLRIGALNTVNGSWEILKAFGRLATSFKSSVKNLGGPIAIVRQGSQAAKAGWEQYLMLCALISLNLAVLNALPIPFLDGGHMIILTIERLRRKDFTIEVKERIMAGGFYFLIGLFALVMGLDLWRLRN